jgi:hypothetical protein
MRMVPGLLNEELRNQSCSGGIHPTRNQKTMQTSVKGTKEHSKQRRHYERLDLEGRFELTYRIANLRE